MKRIVVIGGGTGISTVGRALKSLPFNLTFIVTITDDGGSSGLLRRDLSIPPPGDIRNNLIALADDEELLTKIFSFRFRSPELKNHSLGNLIIAGLTELLGSFPEAVAAASRLLKINGTVLPVADGLVHLIGRLANGEHVVGETEVSRHGKEIIELMLDPEIEALPQVLEAIGAADAIFIGPGSLLTSIVPNFLVKGVKKVLQSSNAPKVFIANLVTQPGETDGFSLRKHVEIVEKYSGIKLDKIYWTDVSKFTEKTLKRYIEKGYFPVINDMKEDPRTVELPGVEERLIVDNRRKKVLRHSQKDILFIARDLKLLEECQE